MGNHFLKPSTCPRAAEMQALREAARNNMGLVHLKTGHSGEKLMATFTVFHAVIKIAIDKLCCSHLYNILKEVLDFNLRP